MNTAQLRTKARELESALKWADAAAAYRQAIAAYPESAARSSLGQLDIANMEMHAKTCELGAKCKLFKA